MLLGTWHRSLDYLARVAFRWRETSSSLWLNSVPLVHRGELLLRLDLRRAYSVRLGLQAVQSVNN